MTDDHTLSMSSPSSSLQRMFGFLGLWNKRNDNSNDDKKIWPILNRNEEQCITTAKHYFFSGVFFDDNFRLISFF